MKLKVLKNIIVNVTIIILMILTGFLLQKITGKTLFYIGTNEKITISKVIELLILFLGLSGSNLIAENKTLNDSLNKLFGEAKIELEVDDYFYLVTEYKFDLSGHQLDSRRIKVDKQGIIFHFNLLLYNKSFSEATIKSLKMFVGSKKKLYIATSIVEKTNTGLKRREEFRQFLLRKGIQVQEIFTFSPASEDNKLNISDLLVEDNNIEFEIEFISEDKRRVIKKKLKLGISSSEINEIKMKPIADIGNWILYSNDGLLNSEFKTASGYSGIIGENHIHKIEQ
ncbi:hypothetical protein [Fusibacter bizertensis]